MRGCENMTTRLRPVIKIIGLFDSNGGIILTLVTNLFELGKNYTVLFESKKAQDAFLSNNEIKCKPDDHLKQLLTNYRERHYQIPFQSWQPLNCRDNLHF